MRAFDPSRYLTTSEEMTAYIDGIVKICDMSTFLAALDDVARTQGKSSITENL